jgi:hypothetical protein
MDGIVTGLLACAVSVWSARVTARLTIVYRSLVLYYLFCLEAVYE